MISWRTLVILLFAGSLIVRGENPPRLVNKDQQIKVEAVTFTGNAEIPSSALHKIMVLRPSRFLQKVYFHPNLVADDLAAIERYYSQQGFLQAQIINHQETVDSAKSTARITISLQEGPRTWVESINLLGNAVFPDTVLTSEIPIKAGDPLLSQRIENATLRLLRFYADRGYLDATVVPSSRVNSGSNLAIINFYITERQQFNIGAIHITGLDKTRDRVIRRELLFHTGEVANYTTLLKSQRRIYLTGLVESVFIDPRPTAGGDSSLKDIQVEIKESEAGEFNVSLGYGSLDRLRTSMEFQQQNIKGTARKIGFKGRLSLIRQGAEVTFSEPWTFNYRWRSDLILIRENLLEPGYDLSRLGFRMAIGHNFTDKTSLTFSFRDERNRLSHIKIDTAAVENSGDIRSLKVNWSRDSRDNLFDPHQGSLAEWDTELAGGFLQGANSFIRTNFRYRWFIPNHSTGAVLGGAVEIGWMVAPDGLYTISLNERFYAGGPNSLRGFGYQLISPLDMSGNPIGGTLKFVWNVGEWRFPVYKFLNGGVFLDAGNVWESAREFSFERFRLSPGLGLRVNSPIGLARLDLAWNAQPKGVEKQVQLWFSMGYSF